MTTPDPCPYVVRDAQGRARTRYASPERAEARATQMGGTAHYEPRKLA